MNSILIAWILMYGLQNGDVVVYNIYTDQKECAATASILDRIVSGPVACVPIPLGETVTVPEEDELDYDPEMGFRT